MPGIFADELARRWSARLGLASTPLFSAAIMPVEHYAMLDGVAGSFAISAGPEAPSQGLDWAWSANLGHHVFVGDDYVSVRNVSGGATRQFKRDIVEQRLDRFFDYLLLDASRPSIDAIGHIINAFRSHRHYLSLNGIDQDLWLPTFLSCLSAVKRLQADSAISEIDILDDIYGIDRRTLYATVSRDYLSRFAENLQFNSTVGRTLDLRLTIRHAAWRIVPRGPRRAFSEHRISRGSVGFANFP